MNRGRALQVGPLPLGPESTIEPLYEDGAIPWVKRPSNDLPESVALVRHLQPNDFLQKDPAITKSLCPDSAINDLECSCLTSFACEDVMGNAVLILHAVFHVLLVSIAR